MKIYSKIIIYVSFIFLFVYLFNQDYSRLPSIISYQDFYISILFLLAGFSCQVLNLKQTYAANNISFKFSQIFIALGVNVFNKYIPGKVMTIIGPAQYLSEITNRQYTTATLSNISLITQLLALWTGILSGFFLLLEISVDLLIASLFAFILISVSLFSSFFQKLISKTYTAFFKKKISILKLSNSTLLFLIPYFFLYWCFYAMGFTFLANAIIITEIPIWVGFSFPLAASIGILAIIFPGGLGIREAVISSTLSLAGLSVDVAIMLGFASRLWFLLGEILFFLSALTLKYAITKI